MASNKLILRSLQSPFSGDITRGSVLSHEDVDNNFIYLKGEDVESISTSGSNFTIIRKNGNAMRAPFSGTGLPQDLLNVTTIGSFTNVPIEIGDSLTIRNAINGNAGRISVNNLTNSWSYELPNNSGIFALSLNGISADSTGNIIYNDIRTTGATFIDNIVYFNTSDALSAYTVDLSSINISGGTQDLQSVLDRGNLARGGNDFEFIKFAHSGNSSFVRVVSTIDDFLNLEVTDGLLNSVQLSSDGSIQLKYAGNTYHHLTGTNSVTGTTYNLLLPDNSGILALSVNGISANTSGNVISTLQTVSEAGSATTLDIGAGGLQLYDIPSDAYGRIYLSDSGYNFINSNGDAIANFEYYSGLSIANANGFGFGLSLSQLTQNSNVFVPNSVIPKFLVLTVNGITADTSGNITLTGISNSDTYTTGATFSNNTLSLRNNSGTTISTLINNFSGLTVNGGISATTISATTYFGSGSNLTGIPDNDRFITGVTFSNNILSLANNSGTTISTLLNNFSGLTVNGSISATTISATTFYGNGSNLTGIAGSDTYTTGTTFSNNTLSLRDNTGGTISTLIDNFSGLTVNGGISVLSISATTISASTFYGDGSNLTGILSFDTTVTAGTYNSSTGVVTFYSNSGTTFDVNGFLTGYTDTDRYITGSTFSNNILRLTNNSGVTVSTLINNFSGLTVNGPVSATTYYGDGSNLTGITANDRFITGVTFSNNILSLTNNSGTSISTLINNFSGLTVNGSISATTFYGNGSNLTGISAGNDTYTTGATFSNNTLLLRNNSGTTISTLINNFSGLTVNGGMSATTISATTFYGSGSNLTGIPDNDRFITGSTFNNNTLLLTNNSGTSVSTLLNNFSGLTVNGSVSATTFFGNGSNLTGITTLYTSNGTLSGDRIINTNDKILTFSSSTVPNQLYISGNTVGINTIPTSAYSLTVSGKTRSTSSFNVGTYITGVGMPAKIHTDGEIRGFGGFNMANPGTAGNSAFSGMFPNGGNSVKFMAGNNIVFTIGNTTEAVRFYSAFSPTTGSTTFWGTRISYDVDPTTGSNSSSVTQLIINPFYSQKTFGTGILRGIHYMPSIISLNGSKHIAFENTSGDIVLNSVTGNTSIGTTGTSNNKLFVSGTTDPLKIVGLQSGVDTLYLTIDGDGVVHTGSGAAGGGSSPIITGGTFTNNILRLTNNSGTSVSTLINNFSGLTVNGSVSSNTISATTISATTLFGNGSNLTGLPTYPIITGGTFVSNNLTLRNNTGGTITTLLTSFSGLSVNGNFSATTVAAPTISATTFFGDGSQLTGIVGGSGTTNNKMTFNSIVPSTYTLVLADGTDKMIVEMTSLSPNTVTVPPNSSVGFSAGTQITIVQSGSGQTTIVAGSGVTILSAGGALKLASQYSFATLIKKSTNTWYLTGDITT